MLSGRQGISRSGITNSQLALLVLSGINDGPGLCAPVLKNKKKKCLPNAAIPGIPRLRAGTDLLNVGNYVASGHFQRSRASAGAGPFNIESYESRAGDQEGYCASDHERTGASDHERTGTSDRERAGAGDDEKIDESDHKGADAGAC